VGCVVPGGGWDQAGVDEPELDELDELEVDAAGEAGGVDELELSDVDVEVDDDVEVVELDEVDDEPEDPDDPPERLSVL